MRTRLPVDPAGCKGDAIAGRANRYANRDQRCPAACHLRCLWTV